LNRGRSGGSGGPSARDLLERAKDLGLSGPGPTEAHFRHSLGFADVVIETRGGRHTGRSFNLLDLGAGGGIPGLVLADALPEASVTLLDAHERRCGLLHEWVAEADWSSRVSVACGRAEDLGRDPSLRGTFDVVVARSFGRPAVTAECAAPFLKVEGLLVVSDPPVYQDPSPLGRNEVSRALRWPAEGLRMLGLEPESETTRPFHFSVFRQRSLCPDRFPRRTGIPAKRPLF
jgi:16S rRNA (guanine527-N7)-methyltransferase